MSRGGAPIGNNNAAKGSEWRDAIHYELARIGRDIEGDDPAYRKGLRQCAAEFIKAAQSGEMWALKELGDRTDGKSPQALTVAAPDGGPVQVEWNILPVTTLPNVDETDPEA
jgi:hypothetical protein